MKKHETTAIPWIAKRGSIYALAPIQNYQLFRPTKACTDQTILANAGLVVRAVNSFEALRAVAQRVLRGDGDLTEVYELAEKALSMADQGTMEND